MQKEKTAVCLRRQNSSDWEIFELWQQKNKIENSSKCACELAFTKQKHKTVEFI